MMLLTKEVLEVLLTKLKIKDGITICPRCFEVYYDLGFCCQCDNDS